VLSSIGVQLPLAHAGEPLAVWQRGRHSPDPELPMWHSKPFSHWLEALHTLPLAPLPGLAQLLNQPLGLHFWPSGQPLSLNGSHAAAGLHTPMPWPTSPAPSKTSFSHGTPGLHVAAGLAPL
jgi:hypothetical protein